MPATFRPNRRSLFRYFRSYLVDGAVYSAVGVVVLGLLAFSVDIEPGLLLVGVVGVSALAGLPPLIAGAINAQAARGLTLTVDEERGALHHATSLHEVTITVNEIERVLFWEHDGQTSSIEIGVDSGLPSSSRLPSYRYAMLANLDELRTHLQSMLERHGRSGLIERGGLDVHALRRIGLVSTVGVVMTLALAVPVARSCAG